MQAGWDACNVVEALDAEADQRANLNPAKLGASRSTRFAPEGQPIP